MTAGILLLVAAPGLSAQDDAAAGEFQARIWLDRGDDPVLHRGDRVRIYYRTSADAYVAVFHIDTDGTVRLLSPRSPDDDHYVRGGRDYRLLFPQSPYWFVDEYPGKGYFFAVASPQPFDFSSFPYTPYERGWDLTEVGQTVYQDPYVAIDDYVARLIPDWETATYALDFLSYDVGETHEYPRFLCYECHGFRAYNAWNPYTYACSSFRVVIWDDPYFYPAYRYRGTKVVFAQPPRGLARFEFKERANGETWKPLIRTRQPPIRRSTGYQEPAVAAPPMPEFVPPRRRVAPSDEMRNGARGGTTTPPARRATPSRGGATPGSATRGGSSGATPRGGASAGTTPRRGSTPGSVVRPPSRPSSALPGRSDSPTSRRGGVTPPVVDPRTSSPARGRPSTSSPTQPRRTDQRPTLQRRPPTKGVTPKRSGGRQPSVRPPPARPTVKPKRSGGGGGSSSSRARPSRPTGGSRSSPARRSSPPRRSSSGSRPAARPSGSRSRPPARASRPTSGRSGGSAKRPPAKRRGGGGGGPL